MLVRLFLFWLLTRCDGTTAYRRCRCPTGLAFAIHTGTTRHGGFFIEFGQQVIDIGGCSGGLVFLGVSTAAFGSATRLRRLIDKIPHAGIAHTIGGCVGSQGRRTLFGLARLAQGLLGQGSTRA
eukprot:scaffold381_cov178-Amphora_coffeaeformis.AAC.4